MTQSHLFLIILFQTQVFWKQILSNSTIPCSIPSFSTSGVIVAGGNGQGAQAQQLNLPYGLYIDSNNSVYIGDVGNDRIQFWPSGALTGIIVAGGQGFGSNASQLDGARDVYVDSTSNLIVLDTGNRRIQRYNRSSSSLIGTTIMSNLPLSCRNMFIEPTTNIIYVSDMYNHSVLRMPAVTLVAGGNGFGSQSNQLYFPAGLFVTSSGTIYVADAFNDQIQMWTSGANAGITVAGGNGRGSAVNQLNSPMHVIYMVLTGNLIITDSGNARIQVWAPNATCGITVISSQFVYPIASAFDLMNKNLYVVDQVACQVKRFTLLSNNSLCIPGNCSIVVQTITTTLTTLVSNISSTTAIDVTTTQQVEGGIPSWSMVLLCVGSVFLIVIVLFIYNLKNMLKTKMSVEAVV